MIQNKKVFVLGLGAQKAATSWFYHYLNSDEHADFGGLKEYRVWDALDLPAMSYFDVRPHRLFNRAVVRITSKLRNRGDNPWKLRGALQNDTSEYFDYFNGLLDQPGITLTGDITPTYASLPEATLEMIRDNLHARQIDVKALFLMRDPVKRAISAARMNRDKHDWRESVPHFVSFDKAVLQYAQSDFHDLIANYERTVTRMERVFGPENCYFGFYENIFDLDSLKEKSDFFEVAFRPEKIKKKFYKAKSSSDVSPEVKAALRDMFDPTYRFCAARFPITKELWQ